MIDNLTLSVTTTFLTKRDAFSFQLPEVLYRQGSWHRHQCLLDGEQCCLEIDIDAHVELHLEVKNFSQSKKSR